MELTLAVILLILGLGLVAGFTAGFVGVGGGIIMVPILLELFRSWGLPAESVVQAAMGTSLSVAVFSVSSSIFRHSRQQRVLWRLVPYLASTLGDTDPEVVKSAARTLATLGAKEAEGALIKLMQSSRPDLRREAVLALGKLEI